ncbi:MAG: hypothetical protein ACJ778_13770 [Chloroflexota bacterium]
MRAGSAISSGVRHATSIGLQALLVSAIVIALMVAIATAAGQAPGGANKVFAAKGGRGNLTSGGASIVVDQSGEALALGSRVTLTTHIVGLAGNEWAMVYLKCNEGDTVVYGQLDYPETTFVLGGGSSLWREIGGTARCTGYLKAYSKSGDSRTLATSVGFEAN